MSETEAVSGYVELRVIDLRQEIHRRLGISGMAGTALTTLAMNSLAAYISGELPGRPAELHAPGGVGKEAIQRRIAREVLLEGWFDHRDDTGNARPFNKGELIKILEHMDDVGDQREWSGEPTELGDNAE